MIIVVISVFQSEHIVVKFLSAAINYLASLYLSRNCELKVFVDFQGTTHSAETLPPSYFTHSCAFFAKIKARTQPHLKKRPFHLISFYHLRFSSFFCVCMFSVVGQVFCLWFTIAAHRQPLIKTYWSEQKGVISCRCFSDGQK